MPKIGYKSPRVGRAVHPSELLTPLIRTSSHDLEHEIGLSRRISRDAGETKAGQKTRAKLGSSVLAQSSVPVIRESQTNSINGLR